MPCMGPGINKGQFEQAYEEIMAMLKEKYRIQDCDPFINVANLMKCRDETNAKFKAALEAVFYQQACEDF